MARLQSPGTGVDCGVCACEPGRGRARHGLLLRRGHGLDWPFQWLFWLGLGTGMIRGVWAAYVTW